MLLPTLWWGPRTQPPKQRVRSTQGEGAGEILPTLFPGQWAQTSRQWVCSTQRGQRKATCPLVGAVGTAA